MDLKGPLNKFQNCPILPSKNKTENIMFQLQNWGLVFKHRKNEWLICMTTSVQIRKSYSQATKAQHKIIFQTHYIPITLDLKFLGAELFLTQSNSYRYQFECNPWVLFFVEGFWVRFYSNIIYLGF